MTRLLSLALACGLVPAIVRADVTVSPDPASLAVSADDRARAEELVHQLGSRAYPDRVAATRELRLMGRRALDAIRESAGTAPSPDVRFRCELLLPAAEADDFAVRMAAFVADVHGDYDHQLPGWNEFRAVAGADGNGRKLFARLLGSAANREILAGFGQSQGAAADRLAGRMAEIQELMYPRFRPSGFRPYVATTEDAVTILFAEAALGDAAPPTRGVNSTTLVSHTTFREAFKTDADRSALSRVVRHWLDTRTGPTGAVTAMTVARNLALDEYPEYIARVIDADGLNATTRAGAMCNLARLGGAEHVARLTPHFDDDAIVRRQANLPDVRVRDVALAMSLVLAEKDPTAYGFTARSTRDTNRFSYLNYYFPTDDARSKAFARWPEVSKSLPGN